MSEQYPQDAINGYLGPGGHFYADARWGVQADQIVLSYYRDGGTKVGEERYWRPDYVESLYKEKRIRQIAEKDDAVKWRHGVLVVFEDGTEIYRFIERRFSLASTGNVEEEWGTTVNGIEVASAGMVAQALESVGTV